MSEFFNAKITDTKLGFEDHGIFTFLITVEFELGSQCFVGNRLDYDGGADVIKKILIATDVDCWEELKGSYVRIKRENNIIVAIGNIMNDTWFSLKENI